MTTLLNQPYPFTETAGKHLMQAFLFGAFVFLFLIVFQPFGLQHYQNEHKMLHALGYGIITAALMLSSHFLFALLFSNWYNHKTWTVGKHLLYVLWVFFAIGISNWIYSVYLHFFALSFRSFFTFQGMTMLIGVFPVTISTLLIYHKRLKDALAAASVLNQNIPTHRHTPTKQTIQVPSQNKSEKLVVEPYSLLYVKAVENYVEVCTENEKIILRNTLKAVEQALDAFPHIKRCHRSYLVNLQKIKSFSGNAQGLSLRMQAKETEEIPVSRAYVPLIKASL